MNFIIKLWIKGFSIQKTKITSKLAYEITLYDFSYIKYKYKIFISNEIVLKKILIRESTKSIKKLSGKYFI